MYVLIFALFCISTYAQQQKPDFVLEIFRHGARAPLNPQFDKSWDVYGELTNVGMRMHYVLGKALSQKYPHIFGSYSASSLYVRSTDVNRTIMSVQSQLYGLFDSKGGEFVSNFPMDNSLPPYSNTSDLEYAKEQLKNTSSYLPFNYQSVPIHVVPEAYNELLVIGATNCPNCLNWQSSRANDTNSQMILNSLSGITEKLKAHNIQIKSMWDYFNLGDTLVCNYFANQTLPNGILPFDDVFNGTVFAFQWFTAYMFSGAGDLLPLYSFTLLNQLNSWFNQVASKQSSYSAILLSAHDTTLLTLLGAFGTITPDCLYQNYLSTSQGKSLPYPNCTYPSFASQVIFELYITEQPYFSIYYGGLPIPICGNPNNTCSLQQFQQYIKKITGGYSTTQFKDACGLNPAPIESDSILTLFFGLTSIVLAAATIIIYFQRSKGGKRATKVIEPNNQRLLA